MSKVKFFALGGLGENGKNMYVCEVDDSIFILDAGLKYPSVDLLGVDSVYPSMEYLEENESKVKGIFLSHGHEDHIGAVVEVLKRFNISVFGTHFTISILEDNISEAGLKKEDYRLYRINEDKELKFGKTKVLFYNVSHSIPESINIAIVTQDGAIVYAPDFNFDVTSDKKYHISFGKINDISKYGVIALASESLGAGNFNRTTSNKEFDMLVSNACKTKGRIIFTLFSTDLEKIQRVCDIAIENGRRVALIGRKTQRIVNIGMETGYLSIKEDKLATLKFRTENITNEDSDLAVIVTGVRHEPFYMVQRMCNGQDRLIQLNANDQVYFLTPAVPGTERIAARTIGLVMEKTNQVMQVKKNQLRSSHASSENLKMLYGMLKPKYIIPIIGEYRHQYLQKSVALDAGYKSENIIMLENGQVASFIDGKLDSVSERVSVGDVLVDGSIVGDINEVVIKDREQLSEEGIIFVNVVVDLKHHSILGGPVIESKGFSLKDKEQLFDMMTDLTTEDVYRFINKRNIDLTQASEFLRRDLQTLVKKYSDKKPIIIPSIIEVK